MCALLDLGSSTRLEIFEDCKGLILELNPPEEVGGSGNVKTRSEVPGSAGEKAGESSEYAEGDRVVGLVILSSFEGKV